ncbi:MAG TPA: hypothetical protein VFA03_12435 [Acetobacteraceae bacterium]|nr:hypothetical protein [Acetobacteraceae bacterium]
MELLYSVLLFLLLVGAAWGCILIQPLLRPHHRSPDTADFVRLVVTMMVTFAAVALGLLITTAKANFDSVSDDMRGYAVQIIELNRLMRVYGPETDEARQLLKTYTAAAIATTWPNETPPPGAIAPPPSPGDALIENTTLGRMLSQIGTLLAGLRPETPLQTQIAAAARAHFDVLLQRRWKLIEEAPGRVSAPFYGIMALWMVMVFASFGLVAPRNALVAALIVLCGLSIASAEFIVLEMNTPFSGLIQIPSAPLRAALQHLG